MSLFDIDPIGCAVLDATICFSLSCFCVSLHHWGSPNLVPIVIAKVPFYQTDIDSCIGHAKHFAAFISNSVRHVQNSESYLLPLLHITLHNSYSCTQQISAHALPSFLILISNGHPFSARLITIASLLSKTACETCTP